MARKEIDDMPMLTEESISSTSEVLTSRNRSASLSIPMNRLDNYENETVAVPMSGLGIDNKVRGPPKPERYSSNTFDRKFHNALCGTGDAKGWAKRFVFFLGRLMPRIMDPRDKAVQNWARGFALSGLLAIFVDPLFSFLLATRPDVTEKCIAINWPMTILFLVLRSMNDFIYCLNMLLQFRLAYVSPESTVVGAGELVDQPKEIARNYFRGKFLLDFINVLPLPQIMVLIVFFRGSIGANTAKSVLRFSILLQYFPKLYRFFPLIAGQSPHHGFIFESAWINFVINLLMFVLAGHFMGSMWYLLGLQRVTQCLWNACKDTQYTKTECEIFIDCGLGHKLNGSLNWALWHQNEDAIACFQEDGFPYGVYLKAVNLTSENNNIGTRYFYSLFWGFQQISTLAGNQVPTYFFWEVLFTMGIIVLGLLLFALLIGNMQNFLQALGRRRLEMSLRCRDVEQWMSHRRFPTDLRRRVREAERLTWAANGGVNEQTLFENLPEDLQIDIRRHLFSFIKKVEIFSKLDESILDAICERLRQKTYIKDSRVLNRGSRIEKMVFIVRGEMKSIGHDGTTLHLSDGHVCGEELFAWCLDHSTESRDGSTLRLSDKPLISNRSVTCLTEVEAFSISVDDLEEVTGPFSKFLRDTCVQRSHKE